MSTRLARLCACLALSCALFTAVRAPAAADSSVVIGAGDNLYRIALRYGVTVDAIVRHNGLASPDFVFAGQRILVPDGASAAAAAPSPAMLAVAQASAGGSATLMHRVAPGETLFQIALRYGSSPGALASLNGLHAAGLIFAGQDLAIPRSADSAGGAAVPAPVVPPAGPSSRRIVIDLSDQRLYAYEDDRLVNSLIISSGTAATPTPIGDFAVYSRLPSQDMSGPGYYAPGVPWVQYFTGAYAIHGAYWHSNFGLPVSHGCVNLRTPDAEWLYAWSRQGTPVKVQG